VIALANRPFSKQDLFRLAEVIARLTGNQVLDKHHAMIESRLKTHISKLGLSSLDEYWKYFDENEDVESIVLTGLMTTHYTFFFREYIHFEALEKWLEQNVSQLKTRSANGVPSKLRVWSAACSKGQEVYSLAMFLYDECLHKYGVDFEILATDIDPASVNFAQNGVYPLKEVNTIPQHYLSRFWKKGTGDIKDFAAVKPELRSRVRFDAINLLDLPKNNEKFDLIFARNVFIYFSAENVQKISLDLVSRLSNFGALVSGVSEPLRFDGFTLDSLCPSFYVKSISAKSSLIKDADKSQDKKVTEPVVVHSPSRYRVLCVDDSPTIQNLLKKIFAQDSECEEVKIANHGLEARALLDKEKFDIITLDIHMPVCGGIEFLEKYYRAHQDPPVLMISSVNRADLDLAAKAMSLGAFDYVEKPALNRLAQSIEEIHMKTHMALKVKKKGPVSSVHALPKVDYNQLIAKKIVVPDASQSLRLLLVNLKVLNELSFILKLIQSELRSPPTLILCDALYLSQVEQACQGHSKGNPQVLSGTELPILKPDRVYFGGLDLLAQVAKSRNSHSLSLQILAPVKGDFNWLHKKPHAQVLVNENFENEILQTLRSEKLKESEITPATSFVSLSLEYFADLRKAQAA